MSRLKVHSSSTPESWSETRLHLVRPWSCLPSSSNDVQSNLDVGDDFVGHSVVSAMRIVVAVMEHVHGSTRQVTRTQRSSSQSKVEVIHSAMIHSGFLLMVSALEIKIFLDLL